MNIETANRLFELRKEHNFSQEELAEKLGVSRQAVSKWERSEASPDTDNLIALAKIYCLSLDELIYGKTGEGSSAERSDTERNEDLGSASEEEKGGEVTISDEGESIFDEPDAKRTKIWLEVPYPIICTLLYLLCGFLDILGGWHPAWIIFVTIPIYDSLVEAIYSRRAEEFAYPVFASVVYLICGCYFDLWHPSWLIFITIPVYYSIAYAIDKKIKRKREG